MCVLEKNVEVEGVEFHRYDAEKFIRRSNRSIYLVREPDNRHDPNLIKVIGKSQNRFLKAKKCIGYVPADISNRIVNAGVAKKVQAHLREVVIGDRRHIRINFDLLGPKEIYQKYRATS